MAAKEAVTACWVGHLTLDYYINDYVMIIVLWNIASALRDEFSQTNIILQYKLLAAILSAVCSVIQQS